MNDAIRVMTVYGTRPEAIKLAPLLKAFDADHGFQSVAVISGQHRHMLEQVHDLFGMVYHHDLDIFEHGQGLNALGAKVLSRLDPLLASFRPDALVVQGDTTTACMAAIAATYQGIPVVHLEAGLRSFDMANPFPEEANRKLISQVAGLHLAPTQLNRRNLLREGVGAADVVVTGNTVIDALHLALKQAGPTFNDASLADFDPQRDPLILVTAHRRENWGPGMAAIVSALDQISQEHPTATIVVPLHKNPTVRELFSTLAHRQNVLLLDALDYADFTRLMAACTLVLTDSGGVQEEAPSLGKPVLVLRDTTERPEAVEFGTVKLVGTDVSTIVEETARLLQDEIAYKQMAQAVNPYGDGHAAARATDAIRWLLRDGRRPDDFAPTGPTRRSDSGIPSSDDRSPRSAR